MICQELFTRYIGIIFLMEPEIVEIIRGNISVLIKLRGVPSLTKLAQSAGLDPKTVTGLMAEDSLPNPTAKNLSKLAKALGVKVWMLMIEDFPFDHIKDRPLRKMRGPAYVVADAMEHEPENIQLLIMEAVSHVLRGIDPKWSNHIKDIQADYLVSSTPKSKR